MKVEEALRRQLQPVVDRRRHLYVAWRLSLVWLASALAGAGLLGVTWLWGWRWSAAAVVLCIAAVMATVWVIYRSRRLQPDYRALARDIEQKHPDLQALLLAAIEQQPQGPEGELGYMQRQVIADAVRHAVGHDWQQSVPVWKLALANLIRLAALVLLLAILAQVVPFTSSLPRDHKGVLASRGDSVTITPGDTEVEQGAPVVVLAGFEGQIPSGVSLVFGPADQEPQRMVLTRSLDDPVFGGIIQDVKSDLLYHVEYADRRTRDYKISVYRNPELLRADARIVYPAYTRLPEKLIQNTRQINVVEGSEVTLHFTLNKPVTTARLAPRTGIAPALAIDGRDPNVLTTSFVAAESQRYELRLTDAQGRSNKMPPRFTVDVHKNLPPEVTPQFPGGDVVVSPLEELTLEAEVADDYGLAGYGVTYALAGEETHDITLGGDSSSETQATTGKPQIHYLLAMEELAAKPDQLLSYYFWADDIGPDGRPRRTAGDMYFAEVRPFEEIFRESQSFQDEQSRQQREQQNQQGDSPGQQAEQLARLQKQIIIATWNVKQQADRSGGINDRKEDLDVIRQSQADALEQAQGAMQQAEDPSAIESLQAAAGHMETSVEHLAGAAKSASSEELTPALSAEQSAYQELLKLRDREHQITQGRNASQNRSANSERFQRQLQQLELTQREDRYETQRLAQSREQAPQREDLQALNRLRDLARRQSETADRLREAQAALREAQTEEQRQEALRELRRLRDEQMQALRDLDELQQQMESPQNRQRMADAGQRLDDSREEIRQSTEALEEGMVSRAITSTSRAQRQLEQMRDEFRQRTSSQFTEEMRQMRDQAQQLDRRQQEISREIGEQMGQRQKTLEGADANRDLADRIDRQREEMEGLTEQMRDVSEQAEASEPLLSRTLYDTLRDASTQNLDRALEITGELIKRDLVPQARDIEQQASEGIEQIRRGVEEAARSVLGDEADSLRMAREQLDELIRQVNDEATRAGNAGRQQQQGEPNQPGGQADQQQLADAQGGSRDGQQRQGEQPGDQAANRTGADRSQRTQRGDQPRDGTGQQDAERRVARAGGGRANPQEDLSNPQGGGSNRPATGPWEDIGVANPLTGADFRQWSDDLRNVEEMLTEQELRDEAARVRDRARDLRADSRRHGREPQRDLVRSQIIEPLTELRQQVEKKLAQLQSEETMAPIDRDPVPDRFADLVRTYFENLGKENP
jgi:hypothetical protein